MIRKSVESLQKVLNDEDLQTSMISEELGAYQFINNDFDVNQISLLHSRQMIHFFFSVTGNVSLSADNIDQKIALSNSKFVMFSYPYSDSTINIELQSQAEVFSFVISMKALHEIFGSSFGKDEAQMNAFIESYKMKRFFVDKEKTPSIAVIIHQFFNGVKRENVQKIYQQGKVMEFLSLYMDAPKSVKEAENNCPYVMDAFEMNKIKEARNIIIENMIDPPSLKMLAKQVGTNEFKLKVGFKSVFHNTVYGFLTDYRMEVAQKLLTVDKLLIKEVSTHVGYSNPSHFIAAYKRKYGVTPKQHVKSLAF
ncbi:MAG: AraC family transcriptional regulator [Bacteroidota bacterium]